MSYIMIIFSVEYLDGWMDGWMYFVDPKLGNYFIAAARYQAHRKHYTKYEIRIQRNGRKE